MRYAPSSAAVLALVGSVSLSAQWPQFRDTSVPRDAQGRVRIDAPPPRTADGKPDLAGNWLRADTEPLPAELAGLFSRANRDAGGDVAVEPRVAVFPPDPKAPPIAAFWDIATNIPGGLPLTPWAAGMKKQRMSDEMKDNPDANCMPMGITQFHLQPQPRKIIQTPKLIVILYESNYGQRYIYLDGRRLPPQGEPQPWWYGYSVGRWEGDTLVVETNNLRGAEEGPSTGGLTCAARRTATRRSSPSGSAARCSASSRSTSPIEDAKAFTKPLPCASISGWWWTRSRSSSSATRTSSSGSASRSGNGGSGTRSRDSLLGSAIDHSAAPLANLAHHPVRPAGLLTGCPG